MTRRLTQHPGTTRRVGLALVAVVAIGSVVAGCDRLPITIFGVGPSPDPAEDLARHRAVWAASGITEYRLDVTYSCECPGGTYVISVTDGAVAAITSAGQPVAAADFPPFPATVDQVFAAAEGVFAKGGTIHATYDDATGAPRMLTIDPIPAAIDDELTVTIDAVTPS